MFNNIRYDLTRYSVGSDQKTIDITETFSAALNAVAGAAIPVEYRDRFAAAVRGYVQGTVSVISSMTVHSPLIAETIMSANIITAATLADTIKASARVSANIAAAIASADELHTSARISVNLPAAASMAEDVTAAAEMLANVITAAELADELHAMASMSANEVIEHSFFDALHANAYGQKNTPAVLESLDKLTAAVKGLKNIPAPLKLRDILTASAAGSKNVPVAAMASEALLTVLSATSQTTETATVQITIPPGGELRIDSELFLVLLNGENVLYAQSGDWINVSRNLLRLIVESAKGGKLTGQLIYTERYL